MRELFVSELAKDVLGPRNGIRESITESPLNEYITGVLAPITNQTIRDLDSEAEVPSGEVEASEDESDDVDVETPPLLSPPLDPKNRPSAMGLSFAVESSGRSEIEICVTWARYYRTGARSWERRPSFFIARSVDISATRSPIYISDSGAESSVQDAVLSLHVGSIPQENGSSLANLRLVNRLSPTGPSNFPQVEDHIFQPQIRIHCVTGTRIIPRTESATQRAEERQLDFLYGMRPVLAKGYLCSAIWAEIDPERNVDNVAAVPARPLEPPFYWIDQTILTEEDRLEFSVPHVRTEYLPLYEIAVPQIDWDSRYGESPELAADVLAESWDAVQLRSCLEPLIAGYERWLRGNQRQITRRSPNETQIAERVLDECESVLSRMRRGVEDLVTNEAARLAFCFANKALDTQSVWSGRGPLVWRPFQLAFILLTASSIIDPESPDRNICDLLAIPTGTGKTEAYLAVAVMAMSYRRRRALGRTSGDRSGAGVSVISRYTLRLLTIQQFRRTLSVVTACEYLRVHGLAQNSRIGWRPPSCTLIENHLWGTTPFSIGLWIGGSVRPNKMLDGRGGIRPIPGALSILRSGVGEGDPAQVLNCPACNHILAVPRMGLIPGVYSLHLVIRSAVTEAFPNRLSQLEGQYGRILVNSATTQPESGPGYSILTLEMSLQATIRSADIESLWEQIQSRLQGVELVSVRSSRPGYFVRDFITARGLRKEYEFDIICPNPNCPLHSSWIGGSPSGSINGRLPQLDISPDLPDGNRYADVHPAFQRNSRFVASRIPIPALTIDDQIYHRIPTIVIATVDKFARPPFEPRSSAIFGNAAFHHPVGGFYRPHQHYLLCDTDGHPSPSRRQQSRIYVPTNPLYPPDLIIQDELHLIEGPLGSLVGLYENAVEYLCNEQQLSPVKYVSSTATARGAPEQVASIFARSVQTFPPSGLTIDDRFFVRDFEAHPLDDTLPGRLYMGICAPGRGPLLPIRNIWARLLQSAWRNRTNPRIDPFWTLTGYFNAIRELAGVRALYRQDIIQRINHIASGNSRPISDERYQELYSGTNSTDLPSVLGLLNNTYPAAQDAVFTTSMFGTGIDIPRIGLMVVSGQPKTTSAYVQSTGRVGRTRGALVVTFLRASRPRDLNHYEYFSGYHRQLHRFVEPVTAFPFAPGVLERGGGPVAVFTLRNTRTSSVQWYAEDSAPLMSQQRTTAQELPSFIDRMVLRATAQPGLRAIMGGSVRSCLESKLDDWQRIARNNQTSLHYVEYALSSLPRYPVVLGDAQHQYSPFDVVYANAPQSLREVEETTGFQQ